MPISPDLAPLAPAPLKQPLLVRNNAGVVVGRIIIAEDLTWSKYFSESISSALQGLQSRPGLLGGLLANRPTDPSLYPENTRFFATDTEAETYVKYVVPGDPTSAAWTDSLEPIKIGTHAARLALNTALYPARTRFWETDRNWLYILESGPTWQWAGGVFVDATANRPVGLVAGDAGATFLDSTLLTQSEWTGALWIDTGGLYERVANVSTAAVTDANILQHLLSAGLGAAGIGVGRLDQVPDDAGTVVDAVRTQSTVTNAAAAAFTTKWTVQLRNAAAALADYFDVLIDGIRFKVGGFYAKFTHANAASQVYTLPDTTDTIVVRLFAQVLSRKTFGDPADLTKALAFALSGATTGFTTTLQFNQSANRSISFPNASGGLTFTNVVLTNNNFLLGGGTENVKDSGFSVVPAANGGSGVAYDRVAALVDLTAQVATTGPTTMLAAGDHLQFSYYLVVTTADALSVATIAVSVTVTDEVGAYTQTAVALAVTATNRQVGVVPLRRASGNVTYTVTVTGAIGTAVYAFHATLERFS